MGVAWWLIVNVLGCPLCGVAATERLSDRIARAPVVIYGVPTSSRSDPSSTNLAAGVTEFLVKRVVKAPKDRAQDGKSVRLDFYLPPERLDGKPIILLADVDGEKLLPYGGFDDSENFVEYLAAVTALSSRTMPERLKFYYKHLNDRNGEIARDAFMEFVAAPFADVQAASEHFDPAHIRRLLTGRDVQDYEKGLLGMMLGMSGKAATAADGGDSAFLLELIENPERRPVTGVDGLMGGYCILERKKGPERLAKILLDSKAGYQVRYAALRALNFALLELKGVDRPAVLQGLTMAALHGEEKDLVINELTDTKHWPAGPELYPLFFQPKNATQRLIRTAVVRFALACPEKHARDFLAKATVDDPKLVESTTDNYRWEQKLAAKEAAKQAAKELPAPPPPKPSSRP